MTLVLAVGAALASAVLGLVVARARHLAWPVFLAIAVCAWLAG